VVYNPCFPNWRQKTVQVLLCRVVTLTILLQSGLYFKTFHTEKSRDVTPFLSLLPSSFSSISIFFHIYFSPNSNPTTLKDTAALWLVSLEDTITAAQNLLWNVDTSWLLRLIDYCTYILSVQCYIACCSLHCTSADVTLQNTVHWSRHYV